MAFEAYLADARARPRGLRIFGYGVSVALHGPPITLFMMAWLTRALLVGGGLDLPDPGGQVVYYQVPVALLDAFPGLGNRPGVGGGLPSAGGDGRSRRGAAGPAKRRTRRPLMIPRGQRPVKTVALGDAPHGEEDFNDDELGALGGGTGGAGYGLGTQPGQGGPGGEGTGPGGFGALKPADRPEPRARPNKPAPPPTYLDEGSGREFTSDSEAIVGTPLTDRPVRISMDHAAYLRTFETFPSPLPESAWPPGRLSNVWLVEVCVSERGDVNEVVVRQSAGEDADAFLSNAIRSWRYRPRIVGGAPRPFCHPIRIVYKRESRFDRRF